MLIECAYRWALLNFLLLRGRCVFISDTEPTKRGANTCILVYSLKKKALGRHDLPNNAHTAASARAFVIVFIKTACGVKMSLNALNANNTSRRIAEVCANLTAKASGV